MKTLRLLSAIFAVVMGLGSVPAFAFKASDYNWDQYSDDFVIQKDVFKGDWDSTETWDGLLCDGKYDAKAVMQGRIADTNLKLNPDQTLTATAELVNIVAGISGTYVSELSVCVPLGFGHNISVDRIDIGALVTFTDKGQNVAPDLHVKVQSTVLGKVTYAEWHPVWFEDFLTENLNIGLKKVWSSSLGDRISNYISEQIAKKIPHR